MLKTFFLDPLCSKKGVNEWYEENKCIERECQKKNSPTVSFYPSKVSSQITLGCIKREKGRMGYDNRNGPQQIDRKRQKEGGNEGRGELKKPNHQP